MIIEVTQEDIDIGCRGLARRCPVARAVNKVLEDKFEFSISQKHYYIGPIEGIWTKTNTIMGKTPLDLKIFIDKFDMKVKVEPFSFELDIPQEFLKDEKQGSS